MKKLLLAFLTIFVCINLVSAKSVQTDIATWIKDSDVDIESIAVSIKDADSGKVIYSLNDKMLMNPASVQKVLTTPVSAEILGEDYLFTTG